MACCQGGNGCNRDSITNTGRFYLYKGRGHLTIGIPHLIQESVSLPVPSLRVVPILKHKTLVVVPIYSLTPSIAIATRHLVSGNGHVESLNALHLLAVLVEVQVRIVSLHRIAIGARVQSLVQRDRFRLPFPFIMYHHTSHPPSIASTSPPIP